LYNRCQACHSLDGRPGIGPSFLETHELYVAGAQRRMIDGTTVLVDDDYIVESILQPAVKITEGYANQMPSFQGQLNARQLHALTEFIKRLDEIDLDERGRPRLLTPDEIAAQYGGNTNDTGDQTQPE
jgi:mono/diheme cytochrome c family protein